MDTLSNLLMGFSVALTPVNLLFCLLGVVMGTLIGALPGIGPSAGVAILLPVTFGMSPVTSIIMLCGIYYGAMYGGTITSVLINVPGESSSVMTAVDGYQMARKGRAGAALGIAAIGSFLAGTGGVVIFTFLAPLIARFALSFGPPEYFALMILGLTTLSGLTGRSMWKSLAAAAFGLMLSFVGMDIVTGVARFTFHRPDLLSGVDFLPVAIGLFGVGEVLASAESPAELEITRADLSLRKVFPTMADWVRSRRSILRGGVIGFLIGSLPGAGATMASFISYAVEKKSSRHPEEFGQGAIEGVAGPESANNSASVGALVPLLTLGVPGSATTAVMMGALMMYGLHPGPLLFQKNPDFVWGLVASMYIGNVLLVILNIAFIPAFVNVLRIPQRILSPLIVVFCMVGAYTLDNNLFDVWLMLLFGVLGYLMKKLDYPPAPLVLALVLGNLVETSLRQSLIISGGSMAIFVTRPISAVLLAIAAAVLLAPALRSLGRVIRVRASRA
ncbi:MAG: tripartite tricarboxylate transporter permease [Firmicutes bacterium]|nr:tripartite tricarboxylate transporter permease [Bacillota bacterium]